MPGVLRRLSGWLALPLALLALALGGVPAVAQAPAHGGPVPQPHGLMALGLGGRMPTAADLERPFETPLPVRLRTPEGRQRVELLHCRDWLQHRGQATGSDNDAAWRVVRLQTVPCEAMALLLAAAPAQRTALPDEYARRPLLTARYPASLWPAPSPDELARLLRPGQTLARASGVMHWSRPEGAVPSGDEQLVLRTRAWRVTMTLLARGDFDRDGWEDEAYLWQAESQRGSYTDARLVVLTRRAAGQVFASLPVADLLGAAGWPGR